MNPSETVIDEECFKAIISDVLAKSEERLQSILETNDVDSDVSCEPQMQKSSCTYDEST